MMICVDAYDGNERYEKWKAMQISKRKSGYGYGDGFKQRNLSRNRNYTVLEIRFS
jgi:hypothetical protein